jgi:hypothetical protein
MMSGARHDGLAGRRWFVVSALLLGCLPAPLTAGTTGQVAGTILDAQKRPVVAATVAVTGTPFGAFTDAKGQYNVLRVPPGTYEVRINRVGFKPMVVADVVVSADNTTRIDATLEEAKIVGETVVVQAKRPPVDVGTTSSVVKLQSKEIEMLPVQELQEVVNLQAGVVGGHFRGGRLGEVQYQVDGVSINNSYDNLASLRIDRSILQEVQVISGTFDAEYGQAMSGVVNAVLKDGTPKFAWNVELYGGAFFFPGRSGARLVTDTVQPQAVQNVTATVSGPLVAKTTYLLNLRYYDFDDYVQGQRAFLSTPTPVIVPGNPPFTVFPPTPGDNSTVDLGYNRETSGAVKLTNTSFRNAKLSYQVLFNDIDSRRINYIFRLNPDGLSKQYTTSITHGPDWTQTLGKATFLDLGLRQNYFKYKDRVYEDLYDPRYDAAGPPRELANLPGVVLSGVDFTRFGQRTNTWLAKGSLTSQTSHVQRFKTGFEVQWPEVEFGTLGGSLSGRLPYEITRHGYDPPDYPGSQTYWPVIGGAYFQDQLEWPDLSLRVGARVDYFDARATVPSDLQNPANSIEDVPPSVPVRTSVKIALSPRLGVAYPITDRAGVHFAYGHSYQYPPLGQMFANSDYTVLADLQAQSDITQFGVLGNPDVKPEKTVQYEMGYKQALTDDFGFEMTTFYKDIRDLLGVEFIETYTQAVYSRLTTVDFGSVIGVTAMLDHRRLGPASLAIDYTWQRALGNSSDPNETATRAANRQDPRPRVIPFNWDQTHTFNMTLAITRPERYTVSAILRAASGQPYTPEIQVTGFTLDDNSGRKPSAVSFDVRAERWFGMRQLKSSLYFRVFNVFDSRFFNGMVFPSTGSPFYSRAPVPVSDQITLQDPTRFYAPRRIELGLTFGSRP